MASFDELFDVLQEYDQPPQFEPRGDGRIAQVKVDLGFVPELGRGFPYPFFCPTDYGNYNEALAGANREARADRQKSDRDPILAARFLSKKTTVLNKDTSKWQSDELEEVVLALDNYLDEDKKRQRLLTHKVFPSIKDVLNPDDLGAWTWMRLRFVEKIWPVTDKGESWDGDPEKWTGSGWVPYVAERFDSKEAALAVAEAEAEEGAGSSLNTSQKISSLVDPPQSDGWSDGEYQGMGWDVWLGEVVNNIAQMANGIDLTNINKPKELSIIKSLINDWGSAIPEEKIREIYEKTKELAKTNPPF